ncbi:MAG: hypothetical protein EXR76_16250 [Myxococcales bacterium]|nr:hypothetical protein [Myxococcales bacterium]
MSGRFQSPLISVVLVALVGLSVLTALYVGARARLHYVLLEAEAHLPDLLAPTQYRVISEEAIRDAATAWSAANGVRIVEGTLAIEIRPVRAVRRSNSGSAKGVDPIEVRVRARLQAEVLGLTSSTREVEEARAVEGIAGFFLPTEGVFDEVPLKATDPEPVAASGLPPLPVVLPALLDALRIVRFAEAELAKALHQRHLSVPPVPMTARGKLRSASSSRADLATARSAIEPYGRPKEARATLALGVDGPTLIRDFCARIRRLEGVLEIAHVSLEKSRLPLGEYLLEREAQHGRMDAALVARGIYTP